MSEEISISKKISSLNNNQKILSLNRQRKTKKIEKYESESIDEEEFKDCKYWLSNQPFQISKTLWKEKNSTNNGNACKWKN